MWKNRILALLLLSSCVAEDAIESVDPASGESDEATGIPDGTRGTVMVRTRHGIERMSYVVEDGHMISQGDLDLGPVSHLRGGGVVDVDDLWPTNTIHYRFADNYVGQTCDLDGDGTCTDVRDFTRDLLDKLSDQLPVDFVEDTAETANNWIKYRFDPDMNGSGWSSIGFQGGEQVIRIRQQTDIAKTTIRHETLHALGMYHEQSRDDRDQFIAVMDDCIADDGPYGYDSDRELGPYDYSSILHAKDTENCVKFPFETPDPDDGDCVCRTMIPLVPGAIIRDPDAPKANGLSPEDVNTIFRMYAQELGKDEANDKMGSAIAIGDFDSDGYDDMAVGLPGENREDGSTTIANAGAVLVYKGTSVGPVAWQILWESDYVIGPVTANARFGSSLVALDYDGDGRKDLAVGAPGNAGFVLLYRGTDAKGLQSDRMITKTSLGFTAENGDRFGAALAKGRVTGMTQFDTGCDDPEMKATPFDTLVIGAPGDTGSTILTGSSTIEVRSGAAYVVQLLTESCGAYTYVTPATRLVPAGPMAPGDQFGAAVAAGDLDGDGKDDIAVGAPHRNSNAGFVATFKGKRPPESNTHLWSAMATNTLSPIFGSAGAQLGTSLAIGNVFSGGGTELVIGAPGINAVWVRNGGVSAPNGVWTLQPATSSAGDQFGFSLAIGDVDGVSGNDVIVGAPGSDGGAGTIAVFRGGGTTWWRTTFHQSDLVGVAELGDQFGSALAVGHLDGDGMKPSTASPATRLLDLAVGAPGERSGIQFISDGPVNSGAVTLMKGKSGAMGSGWLEIDQTYIGPFH